MSKLTDCQPAAWKLSVDQSVLALQVFSEEEDSHGEVDSPEPLRKKGRVPSARQVKINKKEKLPTIPPQTLAAKRVS